MFTSPARVLPLIGIKEGMRVADFGAGSGAYVIELAHTVGVDGVVYAVDIQKELLDGVLREAEKAGYNNIKIVWADLEKVEGTKIGSGSVDVVLISNLLFQIKDKQSLLREASRIVQPYGQVVIIDWTDSFNGMGPQKDAVVLEDDVIELAKEAHLSFKERIDPGEHHYGLIFDKHIS